MSSRFLELGRIALGALAALSCGAHAATLRVCADGDNLPYSRSDASGFENRIAEIVASDLRARLVYRWMPLRRGIARKTLDADACDVLLGVPTGFPGARSTAPYYRSGYAFVYRDDRLKDVRSLADPRLTTLRLGVQLIGADMAATPAADALARRGIVANVRGYPIDGDAPAAQRMVDDLAHDRLDVAVVWGPQIGYFAARAPVPLAVTLISDADPQLQFAIGMAVRESDGTLQRRLDEALARSRPQIERVLDDYAVPRTDPLRTVSP